MGFVINKGDYIDSREFTREECERFCEIAVECGHGRGEWMDHFGGYLGVYNNKIFWHLSSMPCMEYSAIGNITTQFREFLDKEKGMNKFTKSDLKDGMRCIDRDGDVWYVSHNATKISRCNLNDFSTVFHDDFTHKGTGNGDIMRVIDRDGTVVWEREEEPRELTIEEIAKAFNLPVERIRIKK